MLLGQEKGFVLASVRQRFATLISYCLSTRLLPDIPSQNLGLGLGCMGKAFQHFSASPLETYLARNGVSILTRVSGR
eukprot:m.275969 g.275969  ORF g.275969 m.275969 type:complete len:77 (-) comp78532_c0_seq1:65-295(-)